MKVAFQKDYKKYYTVEEYEAAKVVIEAEKDDSFTAKDWAEMALNTLCHEFSWTSNKILEATARTTINHNIRQFDLYGEGSCWMDVTIEGTAKVYVYEKKTQSELWAYGDSEYYNSRNIDYTVYPLKPFYKAC